VKAAKRIGGWEIIGESLEETPDGGGVTIEEKYYQANCPGCGEVVSKPAGWFRVKTNVDCGCGSVHLPKVDGRTIRRIGKGRITDELERKISTSFTIPFGLMRRLGDVAMRERRTASGIVTELLRAYVDGAEKERKEG